MTWHWLNSGHYQPGTGLSTTDRLVLAAKYIAGRSAVPACLRSEVASPRNFSRVFGQWVIKNKFLLIGSFYWLAHRVMLLAWLQLLCLPLQPILSGEWNKRLEKLGIEPGAISKCVVWMKYYAPKLFAHAELIVSRLTATSDCEWP